MHSWEMESPLPKPSPATPKIAKIRTPNAVRSERMRLKLLEATIQCLYDLGYHETSTVAVTKRAGVSRGAMLHQFPTKADLMIATVEYISQLRGTAHQTASEGITDHRVRYGMLVDTLWGEMKQPSGVARIEIMLGSRSDPAFRDRFAKENQRLESLHKEAIWRLAQNLGFTDRALTDSMTQLYAAALRGLAIDAIQPHAGKEIEGAVDLLKGYHLMLLDQQQSG
jgi:AcrR family transcriptional regulator